MENLPIHIAIIFGLTTFLTILLFYKASNNSNSTLILLLTWLAVQAIAALSGFYTVTDTIPPRFFLLVLPPLLVIIGLFITTKGKKYIDGLDTGILTLLNTIRIPVEMVLFWLFINKTIPELMTFEGRNFDIVSGLTAPFIYYFGFVKKIISNRIILTWNLICLGLLINIVTNAALSAPSFLQKFAFDQPNIAILYFPFNWLPSCVVPIVLLSHLVSIRKILKEIRQNN
jgi:hypothetical protein